MVPGHGQAEFRGAGFERAPVRLEDRGHGHVVGAGQRLVETLVAAMAAPAVDPLGEAGISIEFRLVLKVTATTPRAAGSSQAAT